MWTQTFAPKCTDKLRSVGRQSHEEKRTVTTGKVTVYMNNYRPLAKQVWLYMLS